MGEGTVSDCFLPHCFDEFSYAPSEKVTNFDTLLCSAHLQYMYGLAEKKVPIFPTHYLRQFTGEKFATRYRGPAIFARQSWREQDESENIVFKESDIIYPFNKYITQQLEDVSLDPTVLLNKTHVVCSKPITKFLRRLYSPTSFTLSGSLRGRNFKTTLQQLSRSLEVETYERLVINMHTFHYKHAFNPNRDAFRTTPDTPEMKLPVFDLLFQEERMKYEMQESEYEKGKEIFAELSKSADFLNEYSSQFLQVLSCFDVPVGYDVDRIARRCKLQRKTTAATTVLSDNAGKSKELYDIANTVLAATSIKDDERPFYWYHSRNLPNARIDKDKGIVATRNIWHDEEITLQFEDGKYMPLSSYCTSRIIDSEIQNQLDLHKYELFEFGEKEPIYQINEPLNLKALVTRI